MFCKQLEEIPEIDDLIKEALDLINQYGFVKNQISVQCNSSVDPLWYHYGLVGADGVVPHDLSRGMNVIPEALENSLISKYLKKYSAFRSRIMKMNPYSCYPVHVDFSTRIHIPLVTNKDAWMIWPEFNECYQLQPGYVYWVDTTKRHTFVNAGTTERFHLVMPSTLF
jgi:hypothetical protein